MKKRFLALCMTMIITAAVLAGCGTDKKEAGSSKADPGIQKIKDAGKLKVGCKVDVPGFGFQNTKTGEYEGFEIDLAYELAAAIFEVTPEQAKEQNLCEFQGVTAKTRGALLDNGEIDAVLATFTITEERKESWNFSTPYIEDALGLMCRKDSGFETMKDLDGKNIGVAQGATTKTEILKYIEEEKLGIDVNFLEFDGYPALSAALATGNIDVFSVDRAILGGYKDDTTMILPERFGEQNYGIVTAINAKELAAKADQVVHSLLADGTIEKMMAKWGIE